jgi:hypothetical protein
MTLWLAPGSAQQAALAAPGQRARGAAAAQQQRQHVRSPFSSRRVGRAVQRAYPQLYRALAREARAWGRRGTRFEVRYQEDGQPRLDPHLSKIVTRQGMLDEIIDVRSPRTVKVYRGLSGISRGQFDPNYNLARGWADCVAGHWSTALDYARGGRKGLLVEYELPAKLLSYNRGEYIVDLDKLHAHGVTSLAPFVKRVGKISPKVDADRIYRLSRVRGIEWRTPRPQRSLPPRKTSMQRLAQPLGARP